MEQSDEETDMYGKIGFKGWAVWSFFFFLILKSIDQRE